MQTQYEQMLWDTMNHNEDEARSACSKLLELRGMFGLAALVLTSQGSETEDLSSWVRCLAALRDARAHQLLARAVDEAYELDERIIATRALNAIARTGGRATLQNLEDDYVEPRMRACIRRVRRTRWTSLPQVRV